MQRHRILPIDGVPTTPAFDGKSLARKSPIFIEHEDNAFVREGDWKLVGKSVSPAGGLKRNRWELYQLTEDGTELNDLAAKWETWAKRVGVFPTSGSGGDAPKKRKNQNR